MGVTIEERSVAIDEVFVDDANELAAAIPVTPGQQVSLAADLRAADPAGTRGWRLVARWLNTAGAYVDQTNGPPTVDRADQWLTYRHEGVTVPAGAAKVIAQIEATTVTPAGEVHYVDNVRLAKAATVDQVTSQFRIGMPIVVRATWQGVAYDRFTGTVTDIPMDLGREPTVTLVCADGLETLGRARLPEVAPAGDGDTTGGRINSLATAAGYPSSLRAVDAGKSRLGPTTWGASALELARAVELTEFGLLFCDGSGRLVFYDRHRTQTASRSVNVQAAFTDSGLGDDIEMVSLTVGVSADDTWNDVHITRSPDPFGEDTPIEQVAQDPASIADYGVLSTPSGLGTLLRSDDDARAAAQWFVARRPTPALRVREVTVEAMPLGLWDVLLPLRLLDRIAVARNYGPNTINAALLIQKQTETIVARPQPSWTFTFTTTPPPPTQAFFVLGTSALGSGKLGW